MNTPLGGQEPMVAVPVLTFDTHLTAVAATSTSDYTVVFLGTHKGHLKKVSTGAFLSSTKNCNRRTKMTRSEFAITSYEYAFVLLFEANNV